MHNKVVFILFNDVWTLGDIVFAIVLWVVAIKVGLSTGEAVLEFYRKNNK